MEAHHYNDQPSKFRMTSDMIIGGRSTFDEVFLPISDSSCLKSQNRELKTFAQQVEGETHDSHNVSNNSALESLLPGHKQESEKSARCYHASITSVVVIALVLLMVIFGHTYIRILLNWIESQDVEVGCVIFLILYIIVSFPIAWGYVLLMITAGYLYGILYGPIVVVCCAFAGLFISNLVMRTLCRNCFIAKFYNEKVASLIRVIESDQGFKVIALTRLTPIPFGLQNGLFAYVPPYILVLLADINICKYCAASLVGLLPMAMLNCYMGSTLRSMDAVLTDESTQVTAYFVLGGQIVVTFCLLWFVIRKARVELKKTVESLNPESKSQDFYVNIDGDQTSP